MNNASVVKMVKSGIGEDLIVSMIKSQPGKYAVGPDDVVKLKQDGVAEKAIDAMIDSSKARIKEHENDSVQIALKTPVRLSVSDSLSSKTARAGETFKLTVAEDVIVDGHVVIARGGEATGRIVAAEKKSFATHNGKLDLAIDSVKAVDGSTVPLEGQLSVGGGGVGFGRTGKEAEVEKGRTVNAAVAAERRIKR